MNFSQIETVFAVAHAGSFSKAAKEMGLAPQSLMQQVALVERELGVDLFKRGSRGVEPTKPGAIFLEKERRALDCHHAAVKAVQAAASRDETMRIGIPIGVNPAFLLYACEQFLCKHPDANLIYVAHKRSEMPRALVNGEIDLYMDVCPLDSVPFKSSGLFPVKQYCILGKDNPLALETQVSPRKLSGRPVGVWESPELYASLATEVGLSVGDLHDVHRDLSAALLFCISGGVLVAGPPVVELLKETLAFAPLDFDTHIMYAAVYSDDQNPLIRTFIASAHEAADSEDNPWKRYRL